MADVTSHTTPAATGAPLSDLAAVVVPEKDERVLLVPQCSFHLVDLAAHGGLVGAPAAAIDPLLTPAYGAPYWHTWRGRYGRHELPIGYAMLVIRDGIVRRGLQNWDSGD